MKRQTILPFLWARIILRIEDHFLIHCSVFWLRFIQQNDYASVGCHVLSEMTHRILCLVNFFFHDFPGVRSQILARLLFHVIDLNTLIYTSLVFYYTSFPIFLQRFLYLFISFSRSFYLFIFYFSASGPFTISFSYSSSFLLLFRPPLFWPVIAL